MIFKEEKFRNTKWVIRSRIVEEGQTIQRTKKYKSENQKKKDNKVYLFKKNNIMFSGTKFY
jgi:hypothetical protein